VRELICFPVFGTIHRYPSTDKNKAMNQKINLKGMLAMLLNSILQVQKTSIAETKPTVNPKNAQNEKKRGDLRETLDISSH
jgi:hypothetical protein